MAEDNLQERTEEASPKRLREARERGQVPRSRELNTLGVLTAGVGGLLLAGPPIADQITQSMRRALSPQTLSHSNPDGMLSVLTTEIAATVAAMMPFLLLMLLVASVVPVLLGGWTLSARAVSFQWERIDPVKGLSRIFSIKGLVELLKAMAKFSVMGTVAGLWLWHSTGEYMTLGMRALGTGFDTAAFHVAAAVLVAITPMLLIAAIDVPFQLWDHARQLRMSRKELKDELKETEGSPEQRAKIRRQQQELAQARMMSAVPEADVVIVNPTHYAVALRYDADTMRAPVLVAKGVDFVAQKIREVGVGNHIQEVSSPLLARALYYNVEIDRPVPGSLYVAVAQVMAYVFRLRAGEPVADDEVGNLATIDVPDDLRTS